jgi:hypothetical protein
MSDLYDAVLLRTAVKKYYPVLMIPGIIQNKYRKIKSMNIKRTFGALLTILGIGGLIYASIVFVYNASGTRNIKAIVICGILGLIFFFAGISLIRTTKDVS